MAHSSAKKQAITTSTAEVGEQLSPYSALSNLALVCDRGSKVNLISNLFVTNMFCHLHANGLGSYAFLLYRLTQVKIGNFYHLMRTNLEIKH